jgi:ABC-type multidrug transport system permease subunit
MLKRIWTMLIARNKEFYRDKGTLLWGLVFPFIIILGFSFAFSGQSQDQYKVAVYPASAMARPDTEKGSELKLSYVHYVPVDDLEASIEKVRRHQFDLLIAPAPLSSASSRYWINSSSPKGYFAEKLLGPGYSKQTVEGAETRYVDWLVPGILAMNMMFSALFGVGYVIVRYRKSGVLKRFKVTPVKAFEFLSAQIASRILLIQVTSIVVYVGCHLLVHFQMRGSYLTLFLFMSLGAMALISLSTLVAARIKSEEMAEGILNVLTWPMMLFSGVWFSLEGTNPLLKKIAQIFPMTHIVDGARAIMIDGAGFAQLTPQLLVLGVMTVVFLAIGSAMFRWN